MSRTQLRVCSWYFKSGVLRFYLLCTFLTLEETKALNYFGSFSTNKTITTQNLFDKCEGKQKGNSLSPTHKSNTVTAH